MLYSYVQHVCCNEVPPPATDRLAQLLCRYHVYTNPDYVAAN